MLPGRPQTHASPEQRLVAYDIVIQLDPRIAWKIAERHMDGGAISASHTFRWRDSGGTRAPLEGELRRDYTAYGKGLLPRWAELACATHENLAAAVQHFLRLPDLVRDQVLAKLKDIDAASLSKDDGRLLLLHLRETLHWIHHYDRENRYKKYLPILQEAHEALTPTDIVERVDWLFIDGRPKLPYEAHASTSYEEQLAQLRKDAARDLLNELPVAEVLDHGATLNYPAIFSSALANAVKTKKEDSTLVDALAERVAKNPWILVGYAMVKIEEAGEKWVTEHIERLKKNNDPSKG